MSEALKPFGIFDFSIMQVTEIVMAKNKHDAQQILFGWPDEEELDWQKKKGLRVIPIKVSWSPKDVRLNLK